jgi:hypothetical protein
MILLRRLHEGSEKVRHLVAPDFVEHFFSQLRWLLLTTELSLVCGQPEKAAKDVPSEHRVRCGLKQMKSRATIALGQSCPDAGVVSLA